jgi:hypothetical protein
MRLRILVAVAKYLGHIAAQMVMRYSHLVPEVNARAVDAAISFYTKPATLAALDDIASII